MAHPSLPTHDLFDLVHAMQLQRPGWRGYYAGDEKRVYFLEEAPDDESLLPLPAITPAMLEGAMREFALRLEREGAAQRLVEALGGPSSRQAFHDELARSDLQLEWASFRDECYLHWAQTWLKTKNINLP